MFQYAVNLCSISEGLALKEKKEYHTLDYVIKRTFSHV